MEFPVYICLQLSESLEPLSKTCNSQHRQRLRLLGPSTCWH